MVSKIITCVFGLCLISSYVDALKCYSCSDTNSGPCFAPSANWDNLQTCTVQPRSLPSGLARLFSESDAEASARSDSSSAIRCYHYQLTHFPTNRTEVHRGCLTQTIADVLCSSLLNNAQIQYYNLTTCRTCNEDLCNSSVRLDVTLFSTISFFLAILISGSFL